MKLADKPKFAADQHSADGPSHRHQSFGPTPTTRPVHLQFEVRAAVHLGTAKPRPASRRRRRRHHSPPDNSTTTKRGARLYAQNHSFKMAKKGTTSHPTPLPNPAPATPPPRLSPSNNPGPRRHELKLTNHHRQITHRHCAPPLHGHDRLLLHIHPGPHGAAHEHDQIRPHQYDNPPSSPIWGKDVANRGTVRRRVLFLESKRKGK